MKNTIITIILVLLFSYGGYTLLKKTNVPEAMPKEESKVKVPVDVMEEPVESEKMVPMMDYSEEAFAKASEKGRVVLFFHATWCSTCKSAIKDIERNYSDLPEDLTILMVNYDTEKEMKKEYGVFTQHTLVQVDPDGNEITKWVGGGVSTINSNLE